MRTNVAQLVTLLSAESLRKQKHDVHAVVLKAITSQDDPTFGAQTLVVLLNYAADKHRTDGYWIPIFEAYIVGNYDNATLIVEQFVDRLQGELSKETSRAFPPLIIALLKAFTWAERNSDTQNPAFVERFPGFLAQLLRLCSLYMSHEIDQQNPLIEGWARGRLTAAMDDYFHRDHPEFWTRMEKFCLGVKEIVDTINGGTDFLRIVAQELNSHMPAQMAIRAAAEAWLAAKKVSDANESRNFRPTADANERAVRADLP